MKKKTGILIMMYAIVGMISSGLCGFNIGCAWQHRIESKNREKGADYLIVHGDHEDKDD